MSEAPIKEGILETYKVKGTKKGKMHKYNLKLLGGSVYYYRSAQSESKPLYVVHLNETTIEDSADKIQALTSSNSTPNKDSSRTGFGLTARVDGILVTFVSLGSADAIKEWIEAIKTNIKTASVFLPTHQSTMDKAKKNVAGVVVSSSAGKSAIKKILAKPTRKALAACKHVVANQKGAKLAEAFETDVFKISLKIYMLWEKGLITQKHLDSLEETARRVVRKFYIIYCNEYKVPDEEVRKKLVTRKFTQAVEFGTLLSKKVEDLLVKFGDPKTIECLHEIVSIVGSIEFLAAARANKANEEDITLIVDTSKVILGWDTAACENVGALYDGIYNFYA